MQDSWERRGLSFEFARPQGVAWQHRTGPCSWRNPSQTTSMRKPTSFTHASYGLSSIKVCAASILLPFMRRLRELAPNQLRIRSHTPAYENSSYTLPLRSLADFPTCTRRTPPLHARPSSTPSLSIVIVPSGPHLAFLSPRRATSQTERTATGGNREAARHIRHRCAHPLLPRPLNRRTGSRAFQILARPAVGQRTVDYWM